MRYHFEVVKQEWFGPAPYGGGVGGAVLGVSDVEKSLKLYRDVLGYGRGDGRDRSSSGVYAASSEPKPTAESSSSAVTLQVRSASC